MKISEINIYPVKSLGGITLQTSIVEKRGLRFDRRWMLVDENGNLLTQREFSRMATISVEVSEEKLKVSADGFENLIIPFKPNNNEKVTVRVWKSFCEAVLLGDGINKWFQEVLKTNCRLVYMPDETEREINQKFNQGGEIVSFADGYPLLLIGESSLNELNSKLEKKIPMNRFRPNLVVEGSEAFAEDNWKKIKIGETVFRSTKPCERCVFTTIDQETGISDIKEPLKTLASFRKAKDVFPNHLDELGMDKNSVLFGQNLVAENFGEKIQIGDKVEILE